MKKIVSFIIFGLFLFPITSQATTCNPNGEKNPKNFHGIVFIGDVTTSKKKEIRPGIFEQEATFQVLKAIKGKIPDEITIYSGEYSPGLGGLGNLVGQKMVYAYQSGDIYSSHYCMISDYSGFIFIWEYKIGLLLLTLLFFILFRRKIQNYIKKEKPA